MKASMTGADAAQTIKVAKQGRVVDKLKDGVRGVGKKAYQSTTKSARQAIDPYDLLRERGITQTLTDTEINVANRFDLQMKVSGTTSVSNKAKLLQEGGNGTIVEVNSFAEADKLLKEAFPDYQKVRGIGAQDAIGIRKKNKLNRFKQGGSYHKDYAINKETGRIYGHAEGNPHGQYPHINIKRIDGKNVMINIIRGNKQ